MPTTLPAQGPKVADYFIRRGSFLTDCIASEHGGTVRWRPQLTVHVLAPSRSQPLPASRAPTLPNMNMPRPCRLDCHL